MNISSIISQYENGVITAAESEEKIIQAFLTLGATEKQARRVMSYAYEHSHSAGFSEVLNKAIGLLSIFTP